MYICTPKLQRRHAPERLDRLAGVHGVLGMSKNMT